MQMLPIEEESSEAQAWQAMRYAQAAEIRQYEAQVAQQRQKDYIAASNLGCECQSIDSRILSIEITMHQPNLCSKWTSLDRVTGRRETGSRSLVAFADCKNLAALKSSHQRCSQGRHVGQGRMPLSRGVGS
ncbi:hypothetical protein AWV79_25935 [Cupriavidus sp. UYMMa02A]|nr:hypothetical protein AWV79_25935 [Cupriavidus sp. UYMMa02A]